MFKISSERLRSGSRPNICSVVMAEKIFEMLWICENEFSLIYAYKFEFEIISSE